MPSWNANTIGQMDGELLAMFTGSLSDTLPALIELRPWQWSKSVIGDRA